MLQRGWLRLSYYHRMSWSEYLALTRSERFDLHEQFADNLEELNESRAPTPQDIRDGF